MKSKDIEILIEKYLNGETTPEEEKALAAEVSRDDAPQEWKIIAEMLGELTVDEALYDNMMAERNKKPRIMKLWPWVAAACVAAILLMIPTPPKSQLPEQGNTLEGQQVARHENVTLNTQVAQGVKDDDSIKTAPVAQPIKQEKLVAMTTRKESRSGRDNSPQQKITAKSETVIETPATEEKSLAMKEDPRLDDAEEIQEEVASVADQKMEEFHAQVANIQRHGQQLIHRVSMQNNQLSNNYQTKGL